MTTTELRKATLTARQADLERRLTQLDAELASHIDRDWDDMAQQREADEVLEAEGLAAQAEIRMIAAALDRIGTGDYGSCAKCGATIAEARLDALPFTPFCQSCAL